ncbi:MAG: hypothetical protein RL701_7867 [Pseudomonadota bacterium]
MLLGKAHAPSTCVGARNSLQFFATDPSPAAIHIARAGRYPTETLTGLALETRRRFFVEHVDSARIVDRLRMQLVFARQDAVHDPRALWPAQLDLVSCRNLLRSLPAEQRAELFERFHLALAPGGFLLVGRDYLESVPTEWFDCVDPAHGLLCVRPPREVAPKRTSLSRVRPLRTFARTDLVAMAEELRGFSAQRLDELESLDRAHVDLQNFVEATQVLAFICDRDLRVTRASTALADRFGLRMRDIERGLRLAELAAHLPGGGRLIALANEVQRSGQAQQCTEPCTDPNTPTNTESVQSSGVNEAGHSYLVRISPYRNGWVGHTGPFGIVGVLTDVTPLEQARTLAAKRERQHAIIAELGLAAVSCRDADDDGERSRSLRELGERAIAALCEVLGCEYAAVFESGREEGVLLLRAARGLSLAPQASLARLPIPVGCDLHAALAAKSALTLAPAAAHAVLAPLFAGEQPVAGIGCPLRVGDAAVGVVALYRATGGAFAADEVHCVQAIAHVLAGAIGRVRGRRRLALERGVALAVAETKDLSALGMRVRSVFTGVLGGDDVQLWLAGELDAEDTLQCAWPPASDLDTPSQLRTLPAETLVRECLSTRALRIGACAGSTDLVLPVFSDSALVGALRVAVPDALALDEDLLAGLERAASAIGEFVHRARLDEALRESEQRFRTQSAELESIYATLPVGVALHDRQLRCVRSNQRLDELQFAGAPAPTRAVLDEALLQRVFDSGQPTRDIELTTGSSSDPREWLCSFAPIKDSEGHVALVSSVIQDITERKRSEEALRAADRQKDEFLAMLGHELRNPLSAIRNATELLGMGDVGRIDLGRVHAILARQTHQMAKLIDGLLDISRIMRGKFVLDTTTLDVARALREMVQDHAAPQGFRSAPIALAVPDQPLWVDGDSVRLLQVFENLVSNAAKFTPKTGHITVRAHSTAEHAIICIEDDGSGIDAALLPHIFEPFRQANQRFGGLGLGLALVRGLVELHGGSVRADSAGPGLGSCFTVTLRLAPAPAESSQAPQPQPSAQRVLVIEDNDDLAETLAVLLRSIGHEVIEVAETGVHGLALARALRPEVILCDIGLPGELDGLDVARAIRADPALQGTHLIAMTGYGAPDDRKRIRDAGFDACLVKPVELELLQKYLARPQAHVR